MEVVLCEGGAEDGRIDHGDGGDVPTADPELTWNNWNYHDAAALLARSAIVIVEDADWAEERTNDRKGMITWKLGGS